LRASAGYNHRAKTLGAYGNLKKKGAIFWFSEGSKLDSRFIFRSENWFFPEKGK
jgi:hypothetical protein